MHALEVACKIGHLYAVQAALQERAQRQHAASLVPDGDNDFIDAKVLDGVLQRLASRNDTPPGNEDPLLLFERMKSHQVHARWSGGCERSFDEPRFGAGAEHHDSVRKNPADQRKDDRMAKE